MDSPPEAEIDAILERLESQFPNVPPGEVAAVIREARATLSKRPIRSHLSVLVELEARERLRNRAEQA